MDTNEIYRLLGKLDAEAGAAQASRASIHTALDKLVADVAKLGTLKEDVDRHEIEIKTLTAAHNRGRGERTVAGLIAGFVGSVAALLVAWLKH